MSREGKTLVIGIGNADRADDAAGLRTAALLRDILGERMAGATVVIERSGECAGLIDAWRGARRLLLIDAAQSGAGAGTIHRIDASTRDLPRRFLSTSTHAFGVADAIGLARVLNELPSKVIVYAIEGRCFEAGAALSDEVEHGARVAAKQIAEELKTAPWSY